MAKAFIQLYLLIVFTLVGLGWGLDQIWKLYSEPDDRISVEQTLQVIELHLQNKSDVQRQAYLLQLSNDLNTDVSLYQYDELTGTEIRARLKSGQVAHLRLDHSHWLSLKSISSEMLVLAIKHKIPNASRSSLEWRLMVLFYGVIALVIMIWVWPLSRDLQVLEKATRAFGESSWVFNAKVKTSSQLYPLARAFQMMATRIEDLINSHKDLSNTVSHELKTPLARMKFELALGESSQDLDKVKGHLINIQGDIDEMDGLVKATLDYAILEHANVSLNWQEVDLKTTIEQHIVQIRQDFPCDIELEDRTGKCPEQVYCDGYLMERVVRNLLHNGAGYAQSKLRISLELRYQQYHLIVEDDGPGVPPESRDKVFQSFVRLDNKVHREGFGLGLAIVKRIIDWHYGRVLVTESTLGGAKFIVSWPAEKSS